MSRVELGKVYEPGPVESKWYRVWEEENHFKPNDDKDSGTFTVVIPPPNVTGIIHMGHVLNNTIQDILVRRARMLGKSTLWLPGTDHASIATEAKIVKMLRDEGTTKIELGREKFLERAWQWSDQYGGTIIGQLKRLGCSCDWSRLAFTMDDSYSNAVIHTFVKFYNDGLIYRAKRLINWDPQGQTALSDEEVIHKETQGNLWYFRYPLKDGSGHVTVATTRPETMLGDTGIAVNPDDERYTGLVGETVILPLVGRELPIFADRFVDPEFGTGAVKVTPAHDPNDAMMGQNHDLEIVNVLNPDATMNENAPEQFRGMDRFEARKAVVAAMDALNLLEKIEPHVHNVGYSERTDAMVEPYMSLQWFLGMEELAKPALKAVHDGDIKFYPDRWTKVYDHWMSNIHDWCISRQLWWGHRIPAWYGPDEHIFVAETEQDAYAQAREHYGKDTTLVQDDDALDTWFSSWLWPFATLGWPESGEEDIARFYPTNDLVTAPDIIFFWVARMVMAGLRLQGEIPFSAVYFTGIVRDGQGRKMSKSLGNSPDPIHLIEKYSADALRTGMMLIAPQGQDILYSEDHIIQGRNFMNKIWNAARFVQMNLGDELPMPLEDLPADRLDMDDLWILSRLNRTIQKVNRSFERYRINEVAKAIYDFVWADYCDWYLEFIKSRLNSQDPQTRETALVVAVHVFRQFLGLLHPYAPFITEELWQTLKREDEALLISSPFPVEDEAFISKESETRLELLKSVITAIRSVCSEMGVNAGSKVNLVVRGANETTRLLQDQLQHLQRLGKVEEFTFGEDLAKPEHSATAVIESLELFIPLEGLIDLQAEQVRLNKNIDELHGRLTGVKQKLGNSNFVDRAPADVVENERKKQAQYTERLAKLRENLAALA